MIICILCFNLVCFKIADWTIYIAGIKENNVSIIVSMVSLALFSYATEHFVE